MASLSWPITGATHFHAQLILSDKARAIKGFVTDNSWDVSAFGPAKWPGPTLLSAVK